MERLDRAHNAELVDQWFDPETQQLIRATVDGMKKSGLRSSPKHSGQISGLLVSAPPA